MGGVVNCRNCHSVSLQSFLDLGTAPPSNRYLTADQLSRSEEWIPLRVLVCTECWLVQTEDYVASEDLFTPDYAYFSSASTSWLEHARHYVDDVVPRFDLGAKSMVVEIAANDGYLLQYVKRRGIPCVGIEPTASTAEAARQRGIEIVERFLTTETAPGIIEAYGKADLVIANNVFAHVPNIGDFARAMALLLKDSGVLTIEFPRVTTMVDRGLFDTVYHEHYSYLSLHSVMDVLARADMVVFDVEEIPTHGGSLRVFAELLAGEQRAVSDRVSQLIDEERRRGVAEVAYYQTLQQRAEETKVGFLRLLLDLKDSGRAVAGYGAAAKGNTLINFAGVRSDLLPFVVDRSPGKLGKFLPGSRIPILPVDALQDWDPDVIVVLPWNIADEVGQQLRETLGERPSIITAVPSVTTVMEADHA